MKKVTIRDVARAAGVSVATVSRAINGSDAVTPETQQRILEVIRTTGYQNPDAAAHEGYVPRRDRHTDE